MTVTDEHRANAMNASAPTPAASLDALPGNAADAPDALPASPATSSDTATTTAASAPAPTALELARAELTKVKQDLARLERRVKIDALLSEAETTDLQVARLLTELAVEAMAAPDVKLAVEDLRRLKPYLFRTRDPRRRAQAMPARDPHAPATPVAQAADQAVKSGEKRDLLRYLRLRRRT